MSSKVKTEVHHADCLVILQNMKHESINLVYLDPPFFTQKSHRLVSRDRKRIFSFDDIWVSEKDYAGFLIQRLRAIHRVLSRDGSIFFHCAPNANHLARALLDEVFGSEMFRSEIIWYYRRWSNSRRRLLPAHQTIYYYTKSDEFTFNLEWQEYSPSTNIDQILQQRTRDTFGKSIYKRDELGNIESNGDKHGVPLSDVWDIPYLNPKAKERTGYPTQKPLHLLERIIRLSSNEGDTVVDPFCGSGTTLLAANLLGRNAIGIDVSENAVELTRQRLKNPVRSKSTLLTKGRDAYRNADETLLSMLLGVKYVPVQRNSGIDAFLKEGIEGTPVPIRVQRENETILEAAHKLYKASRYKGAKLMLLVAISEGGYFQFDDDLPEGVVIIDSPKLSIEKILRDSRD